MSCPFLKGSVSDADSFGESPHTDRSTMSSSSSSSSSSASKFDYFSSAVVDTAGAPISGDKEFYSLHPFGELFNRNSSHEPLFEEDPNMKDFMGGSDVETRQMHADQKYTDGRSTDRFGSPLLSSSSSSSTSSPSSTSSTASSASLSPLASPSESPLLDVEEKPIRIGTGNSLRLWTGGYRTSLGVEVAHPLREWASGSRTLSKDFESSTDHHNRKKLQQQHEEDRQYEQGISNKPRFRGDEKYTGGKKYNETITYWNYIHPEVLASLQTGRQGKGLNHHDEHLFILVHQVFELWFKQIIRELEYARDALIGNVQENEYDAVYRATQRLNRADKCMRLATEGYSIMETMDPADFLEFRDFLSPSSGFQSVQLREIEIILGLKDDERILCGGRHYREAFYSNREDKTAAFDKRLKQKTLKDALHIFLSNLELPETESFLVSYLSVLQKQMETKKKDAADELLFLKKMESASTTQKEVEYVKNLKLKAQSTINNAQANFDEIQNYFRDPQYGNQRAACLLLWTFHSHPLYSQYAGLLRALLTFEQGMLIWRQRHARMVELFIGRRMGTGGSSGVEFLDGTALKYRVFQDMWRIRSLMVAASRLNFNPSRARRMSHAGEHVYHRTSVDLNNPDEPNAETNGTTALHNNHSSSSNSNKSSSSSSHKQEGVVGAAGTQPTGSAPTRTDANGQGKL